MSDTTVPTTGLASQYIAQVDSDLERNLKEQERITAEIAALQEQLRALEHDQSLLVKMRTALAADAPAEPADTASVSVPRQKANSKKTGKQPAPKRTGAAQRGSKPAKKAAVETEGTKSAGLTLVELIRDHLAGQKEPRSATEVATTLAQVHTDRRIQTNVVRATLEGLVAKGQAQRSKQGKSVFYTTADTASDAAPEATGAAEDNAANSQEKADA